MRRLVELATMAFGGVLIERPCAFCDSTDYHYDGLCNTGPCRSCGVQRREGGHIVHDYTVDDHKWTAWDYEPFDFTTRSGAFEQMLAVLRSNPELVQRYTTDIVRDYQYLIGGGEDERFIWAVRPWGTHIITRSDYGRGTLSYLRDNEPEARYFYWNGFVLDEVSHDTGRALSALPPVGWSTVTA
jgi:hypothetical protein